MREHSLPQLATTCSKLTIETPDKCRINAGWANIPVSSSGQRGMQNLVEYLEMELFVKIVKFFHQLIIFTKSSILHV